MNFRVSVKIKEFFTSCVAGRSSRRTLFHCWPCLPYPSFFLPGGNRHFLPWRWKRYVPPKCRCLAVRPRPHNPEKKNCWTHVKLKYFVFSELRILRDVMFSPPWVWRWLVHIVTFPKLCDETYHNFILFIFFPRKTEIKLSPSHMSLNWHLKPSRLWITLCSSKPASCLSLCSPHRCNHGNCRIALTSSCHPSNSAIWVVEGEI